MLSSESTAMSCRQRSPKMEIQLLWLKLQAKHANVHFIVLAGMTSRQAKEQSVVAARLAVNVRKMSFNLFSTMPVISSRPTTSAAQFSHLISTLWFVRRQSHHTLFGSFWGSTWADGKPERPLWSFDAAPGRIKVLCPQHELPSRQKEKKS